jgi:hypothetical protein
MISKILGDVFLSRVFRALVFPRFWLLRSRSDISQVYYTHV